MFAIPPDFEVINSGLSLKLEEVRVQPRHWKYRGHRAAKHAIKVVLTLESFLDECLLFFSHSCSMSDQWLDVDACSLTN